MLFLLDDNIIILGGKPSQKPDTGTKNIAINVVASKIIPIEIGRVNRLRCAQRQYSPVR